MTPPHEERVRDLVRRTLRRHLGLPDLPTVPTRPTSTVISEEQVRAAAEGSTLRVAAGTPITPLARDAARERKIRLEETSTHQPASVARPARAGQTHVAIGADHGGLALKELLVAHLEKEGYAVTDVGPFDEKSVDYPDYAFAVARLVSQGTVAAGIMIDGVGIGSCMAANKVPGVRASMCYDVSTARNAREHNHANYLTLGGQLIGPLLARQIVSAWLATPFGPDRHARRVDKIMDIEKRYLKQ